ncbi:P-loop containing nucleoside triphosphate hydrolase protein [Mycena capillaripes]|nr:P-loop containing nucleoside triphosphate hydrolase protein [Mycena capillaripes]
MSIENWSQSNRTDVFILIELQCIPFPSLLINTLSNSINRKLYDARIQTIKRAIKSASSIPESTELWTPLTEPGEKTIKADTSSYQYRDILKVFKIPRLRKIQSEVIQEVMERRDVFALMPTGAGKSLCYQLPAVFHNKANKSITVVISPLRSLITDQVESLTAKGINAVSLSSETDTNVMEEYLASNPELLYCTPEKLQKSTPLHDDLVNLHQRGKLAAFAIDEAHCIIDMDFREAYQKLHTLRDDFPDVPIMALTSTANQKTIAEISRHLKLESPKVIRQSLNRPNLNYMVTPRRKGVINDLIDFINLSGHKSHAGIVYRMGRNQCEKLAKTLRSKGFLSKAYHGGMNSTQRASVQNEWKSGKCRIIVATIAFGMGIDKEDVRYVIHLDLPKSLESYYQETGRAGRDGRPADCCLYYSFDDKKAIRDLTLSKTEPQADLSNDGERKLLSLVQYCEEKSLCRRVLLLRHFGENFDHQNCGGRCDNCAKANLLVSQDLSTEAKAAVSLVRNFEDLRDSITVRQCIEVLRGRNTKNTRKNGRKLNPQYGACKELSHELAFLLVNRLLYLGVLAEHKVYVNSVNHHWYLKV